MLTVTGLQMSAMGSGGSMVACQPVGELVVAIPLGSIPLTAYLEGMVTEKLHDFTDPKCWYAVLLVLLPALHGSAPYRYDGETLDCG